MLRAFKCDNCPQLICVLPGQVVAHLCVDCYRPGVKCGWRQAGWVR